MRRIAWVIRLAATVLAGALLITATVVGVAPRVWSIANAHEEVPVRLPPFEPLSQRTYVYDAAGTEIAIFERENRQPITLDEVPDPVLAAILAVEDEAYFEHHGVNVRSLLRATLSNASGSGRQGASTITQQVVKNEFLAGLPRDGRYKFLQIHYASMLEKQADKAAILDRYLNTIFFGNNAYGLQAAADVYFGKPVADLSLLEGAFLAGLIRSPSGYDPIRRPEPSRARFRQVLRRLVDAGMIREDEQQGLLDTFVVPARVQSVIPTTATKPTYYTEAVRKYLLEQSNLLGDTEQARANLLYRGGLAIHTTLDPNLQALAEQARSAMPENAQGFEAAMVSLDSRTGAVRAMVGGRGFDANQNAVNLALAPRQTGSSIKIFILAAALEAGVQPNDLIDGTLPCTLPNPGVPEEPFQITSGVSRGVSTLSEMTWLSINCAYSRLAQSVGLHRVVDTTYRMAHSAYLYAGQAASEHRPIEPHASYATGANEMSPLDMASGAQSIANEGLHHDPYYVEAIDRADGTRIYAHADPGVRVLGQGVALTTIDTLKGVTTRGTGRHYQLAGGRVAAGKTGTQEDNTNAWFVGFTPQLTTAVWVGDPDGYTPMVNVPEFVADGVRNVQGGTYPNKIWKTFMDAALVNEPVLDWSPPPPPARRAMRVYLPGNECLYQLVSGEFPSQPGQATTTVRATTTTTTPGTPTTRPAEAEEPAPTTTAAPVIRVIASGTTIAPNVLDPHAPVPTVDPRTYVFNCSRPPAGVVVQRGSP